MTKLTAISFYFRGRTFNVFLNLNYVDGRPVLHLDTYQDLLRSMNIQRGETFSMG